MENTEQYQKDLEAVKKDGCSLYRVKEQTNEICLEAVKQYGFALGYVKKWFEMMENDSFGFYDAWAKENNGK